MNLLFKLVLSVISGFSEFLFISGSAHQFVLTMITGNDQPDSALVLAIHLGWLGALLVSLRGRIKELRHERRSATVSKRRRTRHPNPSALMDMRIINTAAVPVLIGLLFVGYLPDWTAKVGWISLFLLINAVILFLPSLFSSGNKDSLSYTMLDGLLMGLASVFGVLPGISRIGCMFSVGLLRGADKKYALDLSLLISVPVTVGLLFWDVYATVLTGVGLDGLQFIGFMISSLASFGGACLSIRFLRYICDRTNAIGFAYYSCGLAIFQFLLYLIVQ